MKAFAIHAIPRKADPNGEVITHKPGDVFDVGLEEFKQLEANGAVSKATRQQVAYYESVNAPQVDEHEGDETVEQQESPTEEDVIGEVDESTRPVRHRRR